MTVSSYVVLRSVLSVTNVSELHWFFRLSSYYGVMCSSVYLFWNDVLLAFCSSSPIIYVKCILFPGTGHRLNTTFVGEYPLRDLADVLYWCMSCPGCSSLFLPAFWVFGDILWNPVAMNFQCIGKPQPKRPTQSDRQDTIMGQFQKMSTSKFCSSGHKSLVNTHCMWVYLQCYLSHWVFVY